jgi:hypothetical protein
VLADAGTFWVIGGPFIGALAAVLALGALYYPLWKTRQKEADERNERIDRTCVAVLGVPADPSVGRYRTTPGLIHVVPLGDNEMTGVPTVLGQLAAVGEAGEKIGHAVAERLDEHERLDDKRFTELRDLIEKHQ